MRAVAHHVPSNSEGQHFSHNVCRVSLAQYTAIVSLNEWSEVCFFVKLELLFKILLMNFVLKIFKEIFSAAFNRRV
jgi:hypothetical protein